ncbi:MAG: hypothetical protein ACKVJX_22605 [Verrucomicrobiia bacterium]|jgi:hypothetical protein
MAETLGSLCDKLTIVKLKQFHTEDEDRLASLGGQETSLTAEIDQFLNAAIRGVVPAEKLIFAANKVVSASTKPIREIRGTIAGLISELARVNCELWHEQEKVYEFESVPANEKNTVVQRLAILNLERNACIDSIDQTLQRLV